MIFVNTQAKLNNFVDSALASDILCLDTEFIREKSYYPRLCLIQAQTREQTYIIDPFSLEDLKPLEKLMTNESLVKVFHAAAQDIEMIYREVGVIPKPLFDTQIVASVVTSMYQPGLANLLKNTLAIKIDKSYGFTDWSQRPLTNEQIKYAAEDVVYLPALYDYQTSLLKELGREQWAECELKELQDIEDFDVDPYKRYVHLKSASHLKPFELCLAREVAAWREFRAMKYDIPRRWVLSDELVSEICKRNPYTIESLFSIRGIRDVVSISEAREILGCLKKAREVEDSEWPSIAVPGLTEQKVSEAVSLMNALLRLRAKENELPPQVLATNEQLTDLARGKLAGNKLLDTWRKDIIGHELIDLLHGKIAISINDNSLVVHEL